MNRVILVVLISFFAILSARSQPKALGLRLGNDCQVSYVHNIGAHADFIEADLGIQFYYGYSMGLTATAAYNFMIAQPDWTEKGQWGFYAGPAVKAGYVWIGGYIAVGAQVGLEYEFAIPLQLSIDIRPVVGLFIDSGNLGLYAADVILGALPCLSVRYSF